MPTQSAVAENTTTSSPTPEAPLPHEELHHLYATMLRARLLAPRLRTASHTGEAVLAATLQNAGEGDVIVSATPHPVLEVLRGAELSTFLRRKNTADVRAESKIIAADPEIFASIAAGLALAGRRTKSDSAVIAFAAGKLTRGSGFESATAFAAENRLPLVIIADWTESRRASRDHDGRHLSHWPFPTIAVDGRDVIAVYRVTKEAINAARRGHGPTLIDCVNFLAPNGRGRDERDPLRCFRGYLQRHHAWSDLWHSELLARRKQEISAAGNSRNRKR